METSLWDITEGGSSPLVAVAVHDGHDVREEVAELLALSSSDRLREEDPFTGFLTGVAERRVVVRRSRFEVDMNRPRERAVYVKPEDAWGLKIWKREPSRALIDRSLDEYDAFYREARRILTHLERRFGCFIVLDLHSYNHRRSGPGGSPAEPRENPEVNVGTGTMDRQRWAPVVDRFIADLRAFDFPGRGLDVRENVKFQGGNFCRWVHETFPSSGCALAVEFKKFFMDEWSGEVDRTQLEAISGALRSVISGILDELKQMC